MLFDSLGVNREIRRGVSRCQTRRLPIREEEIEGDAETVGLSLRTDDLADPWEEEDLIERFFW